MDQGVWDQPLGKARRTITIKDKLLVLDYRDQLLKERRAANMASIQPVDLTKSKADRMADREAKKKAKDTLKKVVEKECQAKFPHIVGQARVSRWHKTCEVEHWRDLPDAISSRETTTSNQWRLKVGAPAKGRREGGGVSLELQKELDVLLMEMTAGASEVSERKEIVTTEQVATWPHSAHMSMTTVLY